METNLKKLNLGCGEVKKVGYINVDWSPLNTPDIVHNLNVLPYPFEDNSFELIEMYHVLEHLDKPFEIMRELHRILKDDGILHIKVPHFSRGFTHAEHEHGFDVTFPLYFRRDFTTSGFFGVAYHLESMKLQWLAFFHLLPAMGYGTITIAFLHIINTIVSWLANLSPAFASRIWCFWVGGFDEVEFILKKNLS